MKRTYSFFVEAGYKVYVDRIELFLNRMSDYKVQVYMQTSLYSGTVFKKLVVAHLAYPSQLTVNMP